jgi:hypothetical protein
MLHGHPAIKDKYLLALVRYIHLNPVRGTLAKRPERYTYSGVIAFCADVMTRVRLSLTQPLRCRVGGGAPCGAGLRPPLKLHVRFSRMQLS